MAEVNQQKAEGFYTTKVGGRVYRYALSYTTGSVVTWKADVYLDNVYQGTPSGELRDNTLTGMRLEDEVLTMVFIAIETDFGIKLP